MKTIRCHLAILALILLLAAAINLQADPNDPGIPDTVKITGGPLVVGRSMPIEMTIVNDELLGGFSPGFVMDVFDSGFAAFDSIVFVNRMSDPTILPNRVYRIYDTASLGIPPDSLLIYCTLFGGMPPLPTGNTPVAEIYFTGLQAGYMYMDSAFLPPAAPFILTTAGGNSIYPQYYTEPIEVIEGTIPPEISVPEQNMRDIAGNVIEFDVSAYSQEGFPISLELCEMTSFDDSSIVPENAPQFDSDNPGAFIWQPSSNDIGIWLSTFRVCDSAGLCDTGRVEIQILEDSSYILSFSMSETEGVCDANSILHGNFDSDPYNEIFVSAIGYYYYPTAELYDFQAPESFVKAYELEDQGAPKHAPQKAYLNSDEYLDVCLMRGYGPDWSLVLFEGDGSNNFAMTGISNDGKYCPGSALGEFTGDNYLDYAGVYTNGFKIYAGDSAGAFEEVNDVLTGAVSKSINSADFNLDGYDDLAIGTENGVSIHINNGLGNFSLLQTYSQTYGSLEIEVTNQGSDFNDDDIYDLCISTPSVGGARSEMILYFGNGDGTFDQSPFQSIRGQVFGNCVGDFNSDNKLDIAYVNGSLEYAAIKFGDGDGGFTNEIRYKIPHKNPRFIDCFDIDLDGDLDLAIIANASAQGISLFSLYNQLNPQGYAQSDIDFNAMGNASIDLLSPQGGELNQIKKTVPSGEYYEVNLDTDDIIDHHAELNVVENGGYDLTVRPRPNQPQGGSFSLDYQVGDEVFRLARDIPMTAGGYNFNLQLDENPDVLPRSGKFIRSAHPIFSWSGEGDYEFEFASDIDFQNVMESAVVSDGSHELSSNPEVTDTTAYFWRIRPVGSPEFDCRYVVNLLPAPSTNCGDTNSDSYINVSDAVIIINYVFVSGAAPDPYESGDVNCEGNVNISDAVWIINYIFIGSSMPCDLDGDGNPDC
ncbi:MAG: hypothetical protein GF310_13920 [candidate division Zixibacteria bacterium]|nr:hypothetical protein [candidate division Zixibacteria bacterium]